MTSSCVEGDLDLLTSEDCPTKRNYMSSVSEHDSSINTPSKCEKAPKKKKKKQEEKTDEAFKQNMAESKANEYITIQLEQINKKLENVMQNDGECLGKMIETIVEKMKASLVKRIVILESKIFDKD